MTPKFSLLTPCFTCLKEHRGDKSGSKGASGKANGGGIFSGLVEPESPKPIQLTEAELEEVRQHSALWLFVLIFIGIHTR